MEPEHPRFEIVNREAGIITGLLTGGLENLRKVSRNQAFYYQAFFSLSTGLERLMKLILHVEQPNTGLRGYSHRLDSLSTALGINFPTDTIEARILLFLNEFANGERYSIVDFLARNDGLPLRNEPIVKFFETITQEILTAHPPPRRLWVPPPLRDMASVLYMQEDLHTIEDMVELTVHGQVIDHASKYMVMYTGRVIQPFIERLSTHDGPPNNPYFSEHFSYLHQSDRYFLERKTYK